MEHALSLLIVTPERTLYNGRVDSVTLPGESGRFTILPQHAPIISSLTEGIICFRVNGKEESVELESGFIELSNDLVSVCIEQKTNE